MAFLTGQQISDELERPATTIRTWALIYKDFLPHKIENGRRYYSPDSIPIFKKIQELYARGYMQPQIKEQLSRDFPVNQEADMEGSNELIVRKDYQDMINYFQAKLQRDDELIDLQRQELAELKEQTKILREALGINLTTKKVSGDKVTLDNFDTIKKTPATRRKATSKQKTTKRSKKGTTQITQPKKRQTAQTKKRTSGKNKSWWQKLIG
jgi:DNA-binding transcriptional MerR regulator